MLQRRESPRPRLDRADAIVAVALVLAGAMLAQLAAGVIGDTLYTEVSMNLWFQGDSPRVLTNLVEPLSINYRANVHPAFPLVVRPFVLLLLALGLTPLAAAKAMIVGFVGASGPPLYAALRFTGLAHAAAALFALLFLVSASTIHWSVIEIGAFAGFSVCVVLMGLAYGPTRNPLGWVVLSILSLSMTITNWMSGLTATFARWAPRAAIGISVAALLIVVALAWTQHRLNPTSGVFYHRAGLLHEQKFIEAEAPAWGPFERVRAFAVYSVIAPAPQLERADGEWTVNNQHQSPASAGPVGVAAMIGWLALLACGCWGACTRGIRPIAIGLATMLGLQFALVLVYGEVTFLYGPNFVPMLVMLAALSWFTRARQVALALALFVVGAGLVDNERQFAAQAGLARQAIAAGGNEVDRSYHAGAVILRAPAGSP